MVARYTENEVKLAPETTQRFRAADYGAAGEILGKAVEGFGQDVGKVAQNVDDIQTKYDMAAVKQADAEDSVKIAGIRAKALTAQGFDAQQAITDGRKAIDEVKKERLATLHGHTQQQLYGTIFNQRMAQVEESFTTHGIQQVDKAERGASLARAESSRDIAADSFDDPKTFQSNIDTMSLEIANAHKGEGADAIALLQRKAVSSAHRQVVENLLTDPDKIEQASAWVNNHAKDITPDDETAIRKAMRPLVEEAEGDADLGRILAVHGGDPTATTPDDGKPDPLAPTPAVPRQAGEPVRDVFSHVVGGRGGKISSGFGARSAPIKGASTMHSGVDIPAPEGSPISPPMSGRVVKVWFDAEHGGGWSEIVQHPNGMMTGYAHMRSKPPVEQGDEVDSTTVIGSVGHTGRATGNHLHFSVRDAKGQRIDPQTADWASAGTPVDPAKTTWKEGDLPHYTADKNALAGLLERTYQVATKEGWSPKRYERAITKVKQFAGTSEANYNAQYDDTKDKLYDKIFSFDGGDGLTSVGQLGAGFSQLKGQDKIQVQNLIDANKKRLAAGDDAKANSDAYVEYALAASDPDKRGDFLKMDFRADPSITKGERARLTLQQQHLRNDANGTLAASIDTVRTVVGRYSDEAGFGQNAKEGTTVYKENRRRRQILIDRTTAVIDARQKELGRKLTDVELDGVVRSQVVSISRNGEHLPLYLARSTPKTGAAPDAVDAPTKTFNEIPLIVRNQIIAGLQARGVRPTPRAVIEVYLEGSK